MRKHKLVRHVIMERPKYAGGRASVQRGCVPRGRGTARCPATGRWWRPLCEMAEQPPGEPQQPQSPSWEQTLTGLEAWGLEGGSQEAPWAPHCETLGRPYPMTFSPQGGRPCPRPSPCAPATRSVQKSPLCNLTSPMVPLGAGSASEGQHPTGKFPARRSRGSHLLILHLSPHGGQQRAPCSEAHCRPVDLLCPPSPGSPARGSPTPSWKLPAQHALRRLTSSVTCATAASGFRLLSRPLMSRSAGPSGTVSPAMNLPRGVCRGRLRRRRKAVSPRKFALPSR